MSGNVLALKNKKGKQSSTPQSKPKATTTTQPSRKRKAMQSLDQMWTNPKKKEKGCESATAVTDRAVKEGTPLEVKSLFTT